MFEKHSDDIDHLLAAAIENFVAKRPKTAAMHERAKAVMPGGNTRTVLFSHPFPIRVARAEGCSLTAVSYTHLTLPTNREV